MNDEKRDIGLFGLGGPITTGKPLTGKLNGSESRRSKEFREALAEALLTYRRRRGAPLRLWRQHWEPVVRQVFEWRPDAKTEEIA
jgi:hypothetical protein